MKNLFFYLYVFFVCVAEAFKYLYDVFVWKCYKSEYLGKKVFYKGRQFTITGETYHHFYVGNEPVSFLKDDYKINGNHLLKRNIKIYLSEYIESIKKRNQ